MCFLFLFCFFFKSYHSQTHLAVVWVLWVLGFVLWFFSRLFSILALYLEPGPSIWHWWEQGLCPCLERRTEYKAPLSWDPLSLLFSTLGALAVSVFHLEELQIKEENIQERRSSRGPFIVYLFCLGPSVAPFLVPGCTRTGFLFCFLVCRRWEAMFIYLFTLIKLYHPGFDV